MFVERIVISKSMCINRRGPVGPLVRQTSNPLNYSPGHIRRHCLPELRRHRPYRVTCDNITGFVVRFVNVWKIVDTWTISCLRTRSLKTLKAIHTFVSTGLVTDFLCAVWMKVVSRSFEGHFVTGNRICIFLLYNLLPEKQWRCRWKIQGHRKKWNASVQWVPSNATYSARYNFSIDLSLVQNTKIIIFEHYPLA